MEHPTHKTLADLIDVEKDVYPVGRLDKDSEGLLILTNNPRLNKALLHPTQEHTREYHVQVDGTISDDAISQLSSGVKIRIKKRFHNCKPAIVTQLYNYDIEERNPPIRFRAEIPTSWISLTLTEGKNRQVRRMCAAVGFPVLRLLRVRIEDLKLDNLPVGKFKSSTEQDLYKSLKLKL